MRKGMRQRMGTDLTSKLPLREHLKNMKKIMKVVTDMDHGYFFFTSLVHIINVIVPYIQLMLSAYILDSIVAGSEFRQVFVVSAAVLTGILVLNFTASSVWNRMEVRRERIYSLYSCITQTKMLDMDFSRIDSPEAKELQDRMWRDNNWGAGINSLFWQFNAILFGCFNIIGAVAVGAPVVGYMLHSGQYYPLLVLVLLIILTAAGMKAGLYYRKRHHSYMFTWPGEDEKEDMSDFSWEFASGRGYHYKNGKDVRIYHSYDLLKRWSVDVYRNKKYRRRLRDGAVGLAGSSAAASMVHSALEGGAYLMVAMIALAGTVSVGNVVRLAGCLKNLFSAVFDLFQETAEFALTARKQISTLEFLQLSDEMYKGKLPVEKRSDNEYQIEFRKVSFRYPGSRQYALRDFSMKLRIGEKLAIVGMNGSGKTTMIKLLCRLYDPDEGEILLNGVDIRKFRMDEYSRLFSVVFQDFVLFPYMLAQNVAVDVEYDRELVRKCLRDAGLGERLNEWERGEETYLNKEFDDSGVEVSGGEGQKIAIARAVYKDAPFILLDEPTAALDPLAEYEIYSNFDKIVGTKTAIYISHRLSSCRFCEKIAVFHEGRLVQYGTHDELAGDTEGKYYELWNAQASYYQNG